MKNPYEILGIPVGTPFAEVRAQYFRLAKKHHPDKLTHASEEERKKHEEIFKDITNAYDTIERNTNNTGSNETDNQSPHAERDWRTVWGRVESLFQRPDVWDCMKKVFKDTMQDVAAQVAEQKKHERLVHSVCLPITLEELHQNKSKKLQLFLHEINEPIIVKVSSSEYPTARLTRTIDGENHTINVHMTLKEHKYYRFDDLLDKWDLYITENITWQEYLEGKVIYIPDLNGTGNISITIPMMPRMDVPIVIDGKGVACKGDLYISLVWVLPQRESWEKLDQKDKNDFIRVLNALSA